MTERQVPEDEIQFLHNKLTGNAAFGRLRGALPPNELGVLGTILKDSVSPTDFCRRWDQFCSDARVMGNLLACLKRDGKLGALAELSQALRDITYRLPGETIPIHETEPVTIVIFDFPRTLTMIRWIRCAHWMDLNNYLEEVDKSIDGIDESHLEEQDQILTHEMFEAFPNLLKHSRERRQRRDYEGGDLVKSYNDHVLNDFDHQQLQEIGKPLTLAHQTYNDHLELYEGIGRMVRFGYICHGDQATVLSSFGRELQKRITTWTVKMPKAITNKQFSNLFVGFHPEAVHNDWQTNSTQTASIGCSNGYGAVLMSRDFSHPLQNHTRLYHEASIAQVYLDNLDKQLSFELDVLSH